MQLNNSTKKIVTIVILVLVTQAGSSCSKTSETATSTIIRNIERIFMHEPHHFTFWVRSSDTKIGQLTITSNRVEILRNLSANQPIEIEYMCGQYEQRPHTCKPIPEGFSRWNLIAHHLTIRLHSAEEVDGAGWNHGKFGKGTTTIVK